MQIGCCSYVWDLVCGQRDISGGTPGSIVSVSSWLGSVFSSGLGSGASGTPVSGVEGDASATPGSAVILVTTGVTGGCVWTVGEVGILWVPSGLQHMSSCIVRNALLNSSP